MKDPMRDPLNEYDPDRLIKDNETLPGKGHPIRYFGECKRISLFRSLVILFRYGRWVRWERHFTPVCYGEPGYEQALYEATWLYHRR